jgi:hypothetical protein
MNATEAVEALAIYLREQFSLALDEDAAVPVFKFEKQTALNAESCYVCVNALPFSAGYARNTVNVNIHAPALPSGEPDTLRLQPLQKIFERVVPRHVEAIENQDEYLMLGGAEFSRICDSQPMKDTDNTFFINNKVKVSNYYGN